MELVESCPTVGRGQRLAHALVDLGLDALPVGTGDHRRELRDVLDPLVLLVELDEFGLDLHYQVHRLPVLPLGTRVHQGAGLQAAGQVTCGLRHVALELGAVEQVLLAHGVLLALGVGLPAARTVFALAGHLQMLGDGFGLRVSFRASASCDGRSCRRLRCGRPHQLVRRRRARGDGHDHGRLAGFGLGADDADVADRAITERVGTASLAGRRLRCCGRRWRSRPERQRGAVQRTRRLPGRQRVGGVAELAHALRGGLQLLPTLLDHRGMRRGGPQGDAGGGVVAGGRGGGQVHQAVAQGGGQGLELGPGGHGFVQRRHQAFDVRLGLRGRKGVQGRPHRSMGVDGGRGRLAVHQLQLVHRLGQRAAVGREPARVGWLGGAGRRDPGHARVVLARQLGQAVDAEALEGHLRDGDGALRRSRGGGRRRLRLRGKGGRGRRSRRPHRCGSGRLACLRRVRCLRALIGLVGGTVLGQRLVDVTRATGGAQPGVLGERPLVTGLGGGEFGGRSVGQPLVRRGVSRQDRQQQRHGQGPAGPDRSS